MAEIMIGEYEGSIYPDGNGYRGAIDLGFDAKGRRHRVKRRVRTKAEVKDKLKEAVADLEAGVTTDAKYTVEDAVSDFLAKGLKGRAKTTVDNYRSIAAHNVIPQLGSIKLKELTADHLDDWLDERAEVLSARTLRLIHSIVERTIRQAQARDKVRRNVASLVDVPEGQEGRPSKAMTLNQAVMLLEAVESGTHRLAAYVVLSLLSGVRTEEARALQWSEVDLDAGTVAVYRSVRARGDTKTRKSRRVLELPTRAVQALRTHHARQAAERLAAGECWQEHDLVFCREDGTPLDRWHVRKEFGKITKARSSVRNGVPGSYGTRSCPSSVRTTSGSRTSAIWWATAVQASPRPSTVTRSGPPSPGAPRR